MPSLVYIIENATFDLYRLNEGHTVFVERKITGRLHNSDALSQFMAAGRAKDLRETIVNSQRGLDPER